MTLHRESSHDELGQGLLVLLSGPPGTGKTLMAEAGMFTRIWPGEAADWNSRG